MARHLLELGIPAELQYSRRSLRLAAAVAEATPAAVVALAVAALLLAFWLAGLEPQVRVMLEALAALAALLLAAVAAQRALVGRALPGLA